MLFVLILITKNLEGIILSLNTMKHQLIVELAVGTLVVTILVTGVYAICSFIEARRIKKEYDRLFRKDSKMKGRRRW